MLTRKQYDLLVFIHQRLTETGIPPSFDEMKDALDLASKSGIHRLITALEERGFIRRLPNRARAMEVIKLPEAFPKKAMDARRGMPSQGFSSQSFSSQGFSPSVIEGGAARARASEPKAGIPPSGSLEVPVMGRIAAGVPISAIAHQQSMVAVPPMMLGKGSHYALEVQGDSMIEAGILDGDTVVIREQDTAEAGDIIVALVDDEEATLKRFRRKGGSIALEAANPAYETKIYGPDRIRIQGRLVGLVRSY